MTPFRSPRYLKFIRSLPCCVCGRTRSIEAAHVGPRGMGQKCSDLETIPLCALHHKEQHRIGLKKFTADYQLDIRGLLGHLNTRPRINPGGNAWIGSFLGDEHVLCPLSAGLNSAIRRMIAIRKELLTEYILRGKAA